MKKTFLSPFFLLLWIIVTYAQESKTTLIRGDSKVYNFDLSFDLDEMTMKQGIGKFYALFIAVESYKNDEIPDLKEPIADAENLMKVLHNYYTFEKTLTIFLKNPDLREIGIKLQDLSSQIGENDNLLIFYAGHGEWDANAGAGFWLPADARKNDKSSWLSNSSLRDYIRAIKARHILLITDACFSGSLFRGEKSLAGASTAIEQLYDLKSRKAMTSGSLKLVPDKSIFLEYLIRRLGQNPSKYLPAERLFHSFKQDVIAASPGQVPQYGDIRDAGVNEGGDFVFIRSK